MKRYWKLISVVLVIVIGIGMHYIQSTTVASNNPQFILKKISGSGNEGKNISIFGNYTTPGGYQDNLQINENKTVYHKQISFLEDLNGMFYMEEIKRLQNDYRNFMRGKESNPASFYEDDTHLAYMTIRWDYNQMDFGTSELSFKGEILDKKTNDIIVINESVSSQNAYNYAEVEDVQMANGKLKAVVREMKSKRESDETIEIEEYHIYTFDISSQKITKDENLMSSRFGQEQDEHVVRLNILSDIEAINSQKYTLFQSADVTTEEANRELFVYNYESSELKELSLEKEQMNYDYVFINGPNIYYIYITEKGLEVLPFQIEKGKFSATQTIKIKGLKEDNYPIIKIKNSKMYVVSPNKDKDTDAFLKVTQLNTFKPVYEGTIEQTNLTENQEDYTLHLHSLYIE